MSSCTDLYTSILAPGVQCSPASTKINRSWYIVATHFGVLKLTQPEPPSYKPSSSFRSTLSPSDSCLAFAVLPPSRVFNLILSFPLLKNLTVATHCEVSVDSDDNPNESPTLVLTPSLPMFTGSLALLTNGSIKPITRRPLPPRGCIHCSDVLPCAPDLCVHLLAWALALFIRRELGRDVRLV